METSRSHMVQKKLVDFRFLDPETNSDKMSLPATMSLRRWLRELYFLFFLGVATKYSSESPISAATSASPEKQTSVRTPSPNSLTFNKYTTQLYPFYKMDIQHRNQPETNGSTAVDSTSEAIWRHKLITCANVISTGVPPRKSQRSAHIKHIKQKKQ